MTTKKKRGRPRKSKPKLPEFHNDREIRDYILKLGLELSLELQDMATKTNNIKKASISNAKTQQYKTAISSLKVVNDILKDVQLSKLEEKVELMEHGLTTSVMESQKGNEELNEETLLKIQQVTNLTEEIAKLKEGK